MKIDWETFQKAYTENSVEIRDLIDSGKIYDCLILSSEKTSNLLLPFSYYLLSLIDKKELITLCTNLNITNSDQFVETTLKCIKGNEAELNNITASPAIEHEGVAYKDIPVSDSLNADPVVEKEPESSAPAATPGIRTMARDMQVVQMHDESIHSAASQSDLLNKNDSAPTPNGPRWESET